jgi:predicted Zn-dependent peptidase
MSLERTSAQNSRLGYSLLAYDRIIEPQDVHRKVLAITTEEIQKVAKEVLRPQRITLSVVGPIKEDAGIRKVLTNG